MVELIKSTWDGSTRAFDMATLKGIYILPFLAAVAYLILSPKKEDKDCVWKLAMPCIISLVLFLSPIIGILAQKEETTRVVRLYWTMPFEIVSIYAVVSAIYSLKGKRKKIIFGTVLLLALFSCSRQDNHTYPKVEQKWPWTKADNLYKVPETVYELCNAIAAEQNGEPCRAVFPHELAQYVRQYDASVSMPYGFYWKEPGNPSYDVINAPQIDENEVGEVALSDAWDYIVLDESKIGTGTLQNYGYEVYATVHGEEATYILYHRK